MPEQRFCTKCRKTMASTNFYTYKNGESCELCKNCLTMHVNNFEPETYLWLLQKFDVPYIPGEWNKLRDKAYAKDPHKVTGMSVFGRYLSKMKLKQYKGHDTWADTEYWAKKAEADAEKYGPPEEVAQQQLENIKEAYENGEISEAQYQTYVEMQEPEIPHYEIGDVDGSGKGKDNNAYPVGGDFEQVDLPDVREDLTEEDKIYLALKWGRLYRAEEWVALEKLYNEFMNTFDIQGAARVDTLKKICKTSLKMDQAIDCGDVETYQKLSRVYDALMKSGKFTEAQRKEEKSGEFDSVGQIVFFAEKEGGKIARHEITTPLDIVDKAIEDLKKYNRDLVVNDPALSQMFENFIKRRESLADQKADQAAAEAAGLDFVPITNKDYAEFNKLLEEGKQQDKKVYKEGGKEEES